MTEPVELQGLSIYEFNGLMGRLFVIAPDWAQYLKSVLNRKTNQVSDDDELPSEEFKTKDGNIHNIASHACCVTGEVYGNTEDYRTSPDSCVLCDNYSFRIFGMDEQVDGIVDLAQVELFIDHVEDKHPTMYKNREKNNHD